MKLHLTQEEIEKAENLAKDTVSKIMKKAWEEGRKPVIDVLENLADLVIFFRNFLVDPEIKLPQNRFETSLLMEEIRKCTSKRVEQILYLLKAVEVYTNLITMMENDIIPFAFMERVSHPSE